VVLCPKVKSIKAAERSQAVALNFYVLSESLPSLASMTDGGTRQDNWEVGKEAGEGRRLFSLSPLCQRLEAQNNPFFLHRAVH
jgi:hypothetical protein